MNPLRIRLIDDKVKESDRGYLMTYQLTDQGYDLLFRTKEVEQEISFTIEELKLRELIKRKNYRKAIGQSSNLLQMIRQKKNDVHQFTQKIRENIYDVDITEYERLVGSTYVLLEEEYSMMNEIRAMIVLSEERLQEEEAIRGLDEEMKRARTEIAIIRRNINLTIDEQRELILERHGLSKIYRETIADSFALSLARYYDFEREILIPMERCKEDDIPSLWELLNPLFKPQPDQQLNLLSLYERQAKLKLDETALEGLNIEELGEDTELARIKQINNANTEYIQAILEFAASKGERFRFSELYQYLKNQEDILALLLPDELIFKSMLKLYDIGVLNITAWKNQHDEVIANSTGELDLGYCLYCIEDTRPDLYGIDRIEIKKQDDILFREEIVIRSGDAQFSCHISISDFILEVSFV